MNLPTRVKVRFAGPIAILDLEGDLSHESEAPLLTALREPQVLSHPYLLLNFAGVHYINSAGISLLVSLIAEIRPRERLLLACNLTPHYRKIFHMVGLDSFLRTFDTEAAALVWAGVR